MKHVQSFLACLKRAKWDRMTTNVGGGEFTFEQINGVIKTLENRIESKRIEALRGSLQRVHNMIWEKDIPHPATPEYREWHEHCQKFMKFIREQLEADESTNYEESKEA